MTFGLCNAGQTFQRFIHEVLDGLDFVFVYVDDICVASDNLDEHRRHLRLIFERLRKYGMTINLSKCVFGQNKVRFLGHMISPEGIAPLPERVQLLRDCERPKTARDLKRFIALMNYYRRFLPGAAENQLILQRLIKGNIKNDVSVIVWTDEANLAFEICHARTSSDWCSVDIAC